MNIRNRFKHALALGAILISIIALAAILSIPPARAQRGDGDGAHLKTGDQLTLAPGQMRSFDLSRSEIGGRTESSVEVRAGVHADKAALENLMVAGEVIEDATGKSSLYVPGLVDPPDPISDGRVTSTLGPVGITAGQTARVTFLNVGSNPVETDPCWFDSDGAHLKEGATMTLAPGQMRSFEINWSEAVGGTH